MWLRRYDPRVQHDIELVPGDELSPSLRELLLPAAENPSARQKRLPHIPKLDGAVVNVELLRYPRGGASPTGRVIEILGRPGDLGVDTEIIIRKHHLPHSFPDEVLRESERFALPVSENDRSGREDFRELPIVTIDGETARDFDDAVYVERRDDGGWLLQVHIADVAHYVRPESPLDREARLRGNSVYFIDRAVPMLPEALSNGMCSLNPREERLVLSAIMHFDGAGRMLNSWMVPGVIRSVERMTYTNVNKVLEGDPEMTARYSQLNHHFRGMKGLAQLLNARRAENGSIDFDLPEPVISFDEQQQITGVSRSERNIAHRIIEEFMLAANRAVAHQLNSRGIKSLHRVHEKPDGRKVLEFEELARAFGYSLGVEDLHQREVTVRHGRVPAPAKAGRPDSYGKGRERQQRVALPALRSAHHAPALSAPGAKACRQARGTHPLLPHAAFVEAGALFRRFTRPLRSWLRGIHAFHFAYPPLPRSHRPSHPEMGHHSSGYCAALFHQAGRRRRSHALLRKPSREIAAETSETERRAASAERELITWKTAQYMEQRLGDEFDGLIISVQKYGCFVELFDLFIEGLLPIGALEEAAGARCVFRESDHAIVAMGESGGARRGRSNRRKSAPPLIWKLGDRVRVRAGRIDPMRRRVEFALVIICLTLRAAARCRFCDFNEYQANGARLCCLRRRLPQITNSCR